MLISFLLEFIGAGIALYVGLYAFDKNRRLTRDLNRRKAEMDRRMYELAILKELGERIGYSLNVQQIIDVITGSLHQLIDYSTVSYMLLEPEKIIFKMHLEDSISHRFIQTIRERMVLSLSTLLDKPFEKIPIDEIISGAIVVDELSADVQSFFNIPLVIGGKVVGLLNVAHEKPGLYKEEDMTILYKITQQASNAVTRLEEVIRTEQKKLAAMVSSLTEGVIMTDTDYRIVVANPAARRVIGKEEAADLSIFDFIDNLSGAFDIHGKLEECVKLDKILITDEVLIHDKFFQIIVAPVKHSDKNFQTVLGGVVLFHDITHDKEIEKLREDFVNMIVHELRSPLDGIKKITELLNSKKTSSNTEEFNEYMALIAQNSSHMLNMVNDLLDAAKLEAGKFLLHVEPADITTIIKNRIDFYRTLGSDAHITLDSILEPNLSTAIPFDAARITQVLNNLLSNAIKFTPENGHVTIGVFHHKKNASAAEEAQKIGIQWHLEKNNPAVVNAQPGLFVAVIDTGIGIAPENAAKLFNKFIQFKETALQGGSRGTGLGLVIAKGIVEAHGGTVGVASRQNAGSTFFFTIPFSQS